MAKIVITIEDKENGKVKIVSDPPFGTLAQMIQAGFETTSAQGYALRMHRAALEMSKEQGPSKILIPRIGR